MQKKSFINIQSLETLHWIQKDSPCWFPTQSSSEPYEKARILSYDSTFSKVQLLKIMNPHESPSIPITTHQSPSIPINTHEPPSILINPHQSSSIPINSNSLISSEILEFRGDILLERSSSDQLFDDMVNISCLNEAELLQNLRNRFLENREIFTYVGPTLLIINPYEPLPEVFSIENLALYQKEVRNLSFTLKDFKPHIYAISADVFKKLFENQLNQAIVISGESGAGKTETAKFAMQFLTSLGNVCESRNIAMDLFKKNNEHKRFSIKKEAIEEKILSCNPILEAFGNAKTVRNDNSSRFGKYVTLFVNKDNKKIVGAKLLNYLLEKSRIVQQAKNERNYHIFYQVLGGLEKGLMEEFGIQENGCGEFKYLNQSGCMKVEKIDDKKLFFEVEEAMELTGFSKNERKMIWSIIAGILHLGNLEFDSKNLTDTIPCSLSSQETLNLFESLLFLPKNSLLKCLLFKTRDINKQIIESPLNREDCSMIRDSINKDLYDRLFSYLVHKLNSTISPLPGTLPEAPFCIGLLDIFGFECFAKNSFEQLCINFTNEKLQQLYISYVFKAEQEEFFHEGLEKFICELKFQDNQPIIELLEQPPIGIFNLLDESCTIAGDDEKLLNKMKNSHKKNSFFQAAKLNKDGFIVLHSAKNVEYSILGFREKNKDELPKNIHSVFKSSKNKYFRCIYKNIEFEQEEEEEEKIQIITNNTNNSNMMKSLSAKFRGQMKELMGELKACECHFIRCIKPNEEKKKAVWNGALVLQQIRYLGVLESIKVRKESFPIRRPYKLFYEKYEDLRENGPSFMELKEKNGKSEKKREVKEKNGKNSKEIPIEEINVKKENKSKKNEFKEKNSKFEKKNSKIEEKNVKIEEKNAKIEEENAKIEGIADDIDIFKDFTKKLLDFCLKEHKEELVLYGKSKLFLKNRTFVLIEKIYQEKIEIKNKQASRIQKAFNRYRQMNKLRMMFKALKKLKNLWKARMEYVTFQKMRKSARKIQCFFRRNQKKKENSNKRSFCLIIQKYIRRYLVKKKYNGIEDLNKKVEVIVKGLRRGILMIRKRKNEEIYQFVVEEILEKMWFKLLEKKAGIIQKNIRKFLCIVKNFEIVKKMRKAKVFFKENKASLNIQKNYKCFKKRGLFIKMKNSMNKIKGFFGMIKLKNKFAELKFCTLTIQRIMKPILQRRLLRSKLNNAYVIEEEALLEEQQNSMKKMMFFNEKNSQDSLNFSCKEENSNPLSKFIEEIIPLGSNSHRIRSNFTKNLSPIKEIDAYSPQNIEFFMFPLDIDFMVNLADFYKNPSWSETFSHISKENFSNDRSLQFLTLGDTHTLCYSSSGFIYAWGSNEFSQLGQPSQASMSILNSSKEIKPKFIASGDSHNIMVDIHNRVYMWGNLHNIAISSNSNNFKNNSISNNYENFENTSISKNSANSSKISLYYPTEIFAENYSQNQRFEAVKEVKVKGSINYLTTESGKLYIWPQSFKEFKSFPTKFPRQFPTNLLVSQIACSFHFVIILSKSGLLYSFGSDNREGELGLLDKNPRNFPCLIETLMLEKIDQIECGYRHVICKSSLGKVFTWGWGSKGQLGQGSLANEVGPRVLPMSIGYKAIQVMAGYTSSIILMEDKKIYWFGNNSTIKNIANPEEFKKNSWMNCNDFEPVRVVSQWTKSSSVIFATFADLRMMKLSGDSRKKILNNLISKWQNSSIYSLLPPFVESISKYFSPKTMKFENKAKNKEREEHKCAKIKRNKRKNSSCEHYNSKETQNNSKEFENNSKKFNYNSKLEGTYTLDEMKLSQLKNIKERIEKLKKFPIEKWNERDHEFMKIVNNNKFMKSFIKN